MNTKHTPGPWFLDGRNGIVATISSPVSPGGEANFTIATLFKRKSPDEQAANGRLLASAPALLEALEAIRARIDGEWDHPALVAQGALNTDTLLDCARFADAALAIVKGDSP